MVCKRILAASAALAVLAAAGAASAQSQGWYGAIDLGYHWADDVETEVQGLPGDTWTWEVNDGWATFGRVGYRVSPNLRVEGELGFRHGDIGRVRAVENDPVLPDGLCDTTEQVACWSPDGEINATTLMLNALWDFNPEGTIQPFLGAGVGVNHLDVGTSARLRGVAAGDVSVSDTSNKFAWQGIAGLGWRLSERAMLDITYRYLASDGHEWGSVQGGGPVTLGEFTDGDYRDQSVTVGLRWAFGAAEAPLPPPPPPPPAPPPPPPPPPPAPVFEAREFVVYFPFDQYVLTPEAQTVIQEAAAYAANGKATQLVVVGHADTSGSAAYNVRLSERRAKAVADALVGLGVAGSSLSVDWKGEAAPAVATGDGVKEPLNRRATININF